ncbi:conserved hypothetical protein [Leishmania infantum JPCM5]|uniref:Uncharacterized protein n=3 Tax=Leishmania donovani species complex TaxID=38574 RepID=E9AG26_LEIIN|nr:conserved hypothetical protein [Leishmania infantum JPCM5]XP_003857972.1 hypothetical protein, conserved [Leishmania donovani]CAC9438631.1 hypothetical_protein_-_conserved [Leishmania infantum]AYU75682.1 hypothetical protein LdCL_030005600 [Leishmania donovani]TPP53964.1 hypothetical protein CGC21_23065 [Leishmania donovani]CBZ08310.1 conserved hypothetical protein [Leishmania infantum JPCM5]CBZ31247.1 hypothetical protein, conserved [Leishmania donovani]|eukprot:XP_003392178.1 conserved hypothetical protein [Leishmania infantum JPCM5]
MEEQELSKVIITEAARCSQGRLDSETTAQLARFLSDAKGRNRVYQCCLDLAQDPGRRPRIMMLLVNYVQSFPPSRQCLESIKGFCKAHSSGDVSQDLLKLVGALLREAPLEGLSSSIVRSSRQGYASEFALLADFSAPSPGGGGGGSVSISTVPYMKWMGVSVKKNEGVKCYSEVMYQRVWCPPYVDQFPLLCLESTVERQANIMSTFSANYKTNPNVMQATLFFMKQLCDGYVSKLVLSEPQLHFRSVTICYLPMLLEMMESDYLCVRNHVYDFIFNLGVHVQLIDPSGVYPGCTEALEQEVVWMVLTVTERQAVLKICDETTWTAAAKCLLAVVPPCYRHLADCRVLFQVLQLPGLWELHPEAFTALAQAFARSLLSNKDVDVAAADNLVVDEVAFAKLGSSAMSDILTIYRHCTTPGARKALFQLLVACAARRQGANGARSGVRMSGQLSPEARAGAFRDLMSVDFFWYVFPLLYYMSETVQRELPRRIADGLVKSDFDGTKKSWNVVLPLVENMLGLLAEDAELESYTQARFKGVEVLRRRDETAFLEALQVLLGEVAGTLPLLLEGQREASDTKMCTAAWRLAFVSLRWSARYLPDDAHRALTDKLVRNLVFYKDGRGHIGNRARVGHMCASLLFSLNLLCRTSSQCDAVTFRTVLEVVLFDRGDAMDTRTAMALYHHLIEYLCVPTRSSFYLNTANDVSDISAMIIRERAMCISSAAVQLVGLRVLWGMYRSLDQSQAAAVCRARHVLVLLLCHQSTDRRGVEVRTWRTVLTDSYPPVALLAAEKIMHIFKAEEKPSTATEINSEAFRDVYHDAMRILEKGERKRIY